MLSRTESRKQIIENFKKNVLGKYPTESELNLTHDGQLGHWFEKNLGGEIDSDGNADLNGFECKTHKGKISWGDWSAPYRIYCDKSYKLFNKNKLFENMWTLVEALGVSRDTPKEGIFYSMSGKGFPSYFDDKTEIGFSLSEDKGDISYMYNFSSDQRKSKYDTVPIELQKDNLLIFKWYGTDVSFNDFKDNVINNKLPIEVKFSGKNASCSLEERVRRKFGTYGIVIGLRNKSRGFYGLEFSKSISFEDWLYFFKCKNIIYDTALTTKNRRPYNQWRSSKAFMKTLEEEIYIP